MKIVKINGNVIDYVGEYEYDGKTYFVGDAYCEDMPDVFQARAYDMEGNEYKIYWDIIDHETTDASLACDWESPYDIVQTDEADEDTVVEIIIE